MAIFTPRGLKIQLQNAYCFALMKRLYPKVSPFKILRTTEGFECIKDINVLIVVVISILFKFNYLTLGLSVFSTLILVNLFERFLWVGELRNIFSRLILYLAISFSYINGFLIYTLAISISLYFTIGWQSVVAYFVGLVSAEIIKAAIIGPIDMIVNVKRDRFLLERLGTTLSKSERNFINSIIFYSKPNTFTFYVDFLELSQDNWYIVLKDLREKWPQITQRFTWN